MNYTFLLLSFLAIHANAMCENERNKGSANDISDCYVKEIKKSDGDLMRIYSQYRNTLDSEDQKKLLDLQRSWINYKIKQCDFETSSYGSLAGQLHAQCSINMNIRRISEIKYMKNCSLESNSKFCSDYRPM